MKPTDDRYYLAQNAYVCVLRNRVVLLDVASGKYFGLDAASAQTLYKHVLGWPALGSSAENDAALGLLLKQNLLTTDPSVGKTACPVQVDIPNTWIGELRAPGSPKFNARHVWRFCKACSVAMLSLRTMRLQSIVERVRRRKEEHPGSAPTQREALAELLRIFDWLRPLAFDRKDACFLYSLALVEFLASYRIFPQWIFAVCDRPFKAHCWLQLQDELLTDIPFNVRELTPIMVV